MRDPRTKEDLLNRMLSRDFNGDLTHGGKAILQRMKGHVVRLFFPDTGKKFDLTIHKPRPEGSGRATKKAATTRTAAPVRGTVNRLDAARKKPRGKRAAKST
jgi:hypothetical protein